MSSTRFRKGTLLATGLLCLALGYGLGARFLPTDAAPRSATLPAGPESSTQPILAHEPSKPRIERTGNNPSGDIENAVDTTQMLLGRVLDPQGQPVPGVAIVALPGQTSIAPTPYDQPTFEQHLTLAAESWASQRASWHRTTSDESGAFVLTGLDQVSYSLYAHRADWAVVSLGDQWQRPGPWQVQAGESVHLQALPVRVLELDVRMPDGSRAEAATVKHKTGLRLTRHWSPDAPTLRFASSAFEITVDAGQPLNGTSPRLLVAPFTSGPIAVNSSTPLDVPLLVHLVGVRGITGKITREDDFPLDENPSVTLEKLASKASFDPAMAIDAMDSDTAWSGSFEFTDLEPGWYAVGIVDFAKQHFAPGQYKLVEVTGALVPVEIVVPALPPGPTLAITCSTPDGQDVDLVRVTYSATRPTRSSRGDADFTREPDATYLVDGNRNPSLGLGGSQGTLTLILESKNHGSVTVPVAPGQAKVDALFTTPVALTIEVQGYEQHVHQNALWLTVADPHRHGTESWPLYLQPTAGLKLSGKGAVRIPAMPRGTWQVTLRTDDYELTSTTVTIAESDRQVQLQAPPLYDLIVSAPGLQGVRQLVLSTLATGHDFDAQNESLNDDDRCRFTGLPAGTYYLKQWGLVEPPVEVRVPCAELVFDGR